MEPDFDNGIKIVIAYLPNLDILGFISGLCATLGFLLFYIFNYGKEGDQFIQYHMKRMSCFIAVVKTMPAMYSYIISVYLFDVDVAELTFNSLPIHYWKLVAFLFNLLAISTCLKVLRWKHNCRIHPLVKNIKQYMDEGDDDWRTFAAEINEDFRSLRTIRLPINCFLQYVVTPNWFIRIKPYTVTLIRHRDAIFYQVHNNGHSGLISIMIHSPQQHKIEPFSLTLTLINWQRVQALCRRH